MSHGSEHENGISLDAKDVLIIFLALAISVFYVLFFINLKVVPFEDAAILMRYALHCAQGHGIVWNIGEPPVDGATDFLFTVIVSRIVKIGVPLETATRSLIYVSHIATVCMIYISIRKLYFVSRLVAFIPTLFLAIGPALKYFEAYFATPFFVFWVTLSWYVANLLKKDHSSRGCILLFVLSCLIMGISRAEGVFLALFFLLALTYYLRENARTILYYFLWIFVPLGSLYFLWHWYYFGFPLPNPFYVKGNGIYLPGLLMSIQYVLKISVPFVLVIPLRMFQRHYRKDVVFLAIPLLGFTSMWILLSPEMNYQGRFQYAVLPIILISFFSLFESSFYIFKNEAGELIKVHNGKVIFILFSFIAGLTGYQTVLYFHKPLYSDGKYDVATMLHEYSQDHFVLATSEAGLLPLYSEWYCVDTWGLNTQWIAHNRNLMEEYLDRSKPDIILFHGHRKQAIKSSEDPISWPNMILRLKKYAQSHTYSLAASFGINSTDTYDYYISPNCKKGNEITHRIREVKYLWPWTGAVCKNWSDETE